jgi:hypothetical protein
MMMEEGCRSGSAAMRMQWPMAAGQVWVVERAQNEPDELKNSHETLNLTQTPFLPPIF